MGWRRGVSRMGEMDVETRVKYTFLFFGLFGVGCSVRRLINSMPFNNHGIQPPGA
jgi:hypothetical protein